MGKAILEFDLVEDHASLAVALEAPTVRSFLWDFEMWLRSIVKHGSEDGRPVGLTQAQWEEAIEAVRTHYFLIKPSLSDD